MFTPPFWSLAILWRTPIPAPDSRASSRAHTGISSVNTPHALTWNLTIPGFLAGQRSRRGGKRDKRRYFRSQPVIEQVQLRSVAVSLAVWFGGNKLSVESMARLLRMGIRRWDGKDD